MLILQFLLVLLVTIYQSSAKPLTKEEFDNGYAKYIGDLQACEEDKICTDKVNSAFIPLVDSALESGLEVSCESSKPKSKVREGKGSSGLSCSARNPAHTTANFNFYKLKY